MAAAAVVEFQRAQSLVSTDRNASIDILHSIGKREGWGAAASGGRGAGDRCRGARREAPGRAANAADSL